MTTETTDESTTTATSRAVRDLVGVVAASKNVEGGGFEVYRPFPTADLDWLDPFLLLDELAPTFHEPGEAIGAPAHPHRGFEAVSVMASSSGSTSPATCGAPHLAIRHCRRRPSPRRVVTAGPPT